MPDSPAQAHLLAMLSDQPADEDQLGFAPYAKTLADILADPGTRTVFQVQRTLEVRCTWPCSGNTEDDPVHHDLKPPLCRTSEPALQVAGSIHSI